MEVAITAIAATLAVGLALGGLTHALIRGRSDPARGDQPGVKNHQPDGEKGGNQG